ncbi:MAG: FHA domain-containing protein [Planctomycetes bacterium]|nr:FHA domain-containing protein [Planctomycetota bacterium]
MAKISINTPEQRERIEIISGREVILGRGKQCNIVVQDKSLSRQHCMIIRGADGYVIKDMNSANGTRLNGAKIGTPQPLLTGDLINIGKTRILFVADTEEDHEDDGIDAGQTIAIDLPADMAKPAAKGTQGKGRYALQYKKGEVKQLLHLGKEPLTIGRHKSCGLIFQDKSVSSCHARIDFQSGSYFIYDLGSTNGVKVNGRKTDKAMLRPGTRLRIGNVTIGFKEVVARQKDNAVAPVEPELANNDTPVSMPAVSDEAAHPVFYDVDSSEFIEPATELKSTAPAADGGVMLDGEAKAMLSGLPDYEDESADDVESELADGGNEPDAELEPGESSGDLGHAMNQVSAAFAEFPSDPNINAIAGESASPHAEYDEKADEMESLHAESSDAAAGDADPGRAKPSLMKWVFRGLALILLIFALIIIFGASVQKPDGAEAAPDKNAGKENSAVENITNTDKVPTPANDAGTGADENNTDNKANGDGPF